MSDHSPQGPVTDNPARHRFELAVDGQTAFAAYRREPGLLTITYVESPVALRGTGVAGRLMHGVLEQARAEGLKVVPVCGYAVAYMQRHPEYADLIP
jgi:predicted GNAT family acetyltransferase